MKKLSLLLLLLASSAKAQLSPASSSTGSISTNASTCANTLACVVLHMATSNVGYSVTVAGTWTGTLTVEQSGDNQGSWTSATTTTANTLYTSALTPGITDVRVRGSAAMTGTAVVTITASGPAVLITQTGAGGVTPNSPIPANQAQGPRYNVKNYGAIGDAQHIVDGVTAGSSGHTVTSATAQFVASDVGKKMVCAASGNATPLMPISTITIRNSATQVTTTGTDNGAASGLACIWYTADDTAAFQAANTAALPSIASLDPNNGATLGTAPGTVYCPEGGYAVSGRIFTFIGVGSSTGPSFVGAGKNKCHIYLIPGMADPNDGFAVLFNFYNGIGFKWEGFDVDGLKFGFAFTHPVVGVASSQQWTLESIKINNVSTSGANGGTLDFNAATDGVINDVFLQGAGSGNDFACSFGNGASGIVAKNLYCSNHNQNLKVTATGQRNVFGINGVVLLGGTIDECGSTTLDCTIISSNGILNAHDTTFMVGFTNRSAVSIDATSILYGNNISCGQYGSTTVVSNCLLGASGAQAYLTSSDLRGNGAGGLSVSGPAGFKLFDLGGNKYLNCVSGVCSTATFAQGFGGGVFPVFPLPGDAVTQLGGRQTTSGTLPTCSVTGAGSTATCTVDTGGTDAAGKLTVTANGAGIAALGTFTLTFSTVAGAYGTNGTACTGNFMNGTGTWNARAGSPIFTTLGTTTQIANWDNNAVVLTGGSTYKVTYECYGQ